MKKLVILCMLGVFVGAGVISLNLTHQSTPQISVFPSHAPTPAVKSESTVKPTTSVFVPYWGLSNDPISAPDTNQLIYFGISVTPQGIDTTDQGYKKLGGFVSSAKNYPDKQLAIRMIKSDTNFAILKSKQAQAKVIQDSIALAKKHQFQGIVLDLEIVSLPFESVTTQINTFDEQFYKAAQDAGLEFSLALYADTFYRIRPYDVLFLAKHTDRIMLMAYDFHKAGGSPGPNFPFEGKNIYGYDFQVMITDFLNMVPKEKLAVVFGLFGYDWTLNENGKSVQPAQSMSYLEIKQRFLDTCQVQNCVVTKDPTSAETSVSYTDSEQQDHIVWFETMDSVAKKKQFLKEKGIESVSYWAYSFF